MRVLMFGWEFPPHIAGGLGTACEGIVKGLAHNGVETLFVMPNASGDEDQSATTIINASDVAVRNVSETVHLGTVTLGNHDQGSAVILEFIHVRVHTVGRGGAHGAARIACGRFGRAGIQDGVVLEIGRHSFTGIQAGLQLGVGDVAGHNDGAFQVYTGAHGVFGKFCAHGVDTLVQVYLNTLRAFTGTAEFFGNKL